MSRAFLPVTREVRDRANEWLRAMAARGFVASAEDAVRFASLGDKQ